MTPSPPAARPTSGDPTARERRKAAAVCFASLLSTARTRDWRCCWPASPELRELCCPTCRQGSSTAPHPRGLRSQPDATERRRTPRGPPRPDVATASQTAVSSLSSAVTAAVSISSGLLIRCWREQPKLFRLAEPNCIRSRAEEGMYPSPRDAAPVGLGRHRSREGAPCADHY